MTRFSISTTHGCRSEFGVSTRTACTVSLFELVNGEPLVEVDGVPKSPTLQFAGEYCRDKAGKFGSAISSATVGPEGAALRIGEFRANHVLSGEQDASAREALSVLMRAAVTIDYALVHQAAAEPTEVMSSEAVVPELEPIV